MKFIKWLFIGLFVLVLLVGVGTAAAVYLVDWNDYKDTIEEQAKKHTGRDLKIAGDLSPSVFPWLGVSIGDIALSNAEGFGDVPFAKMGSADVKIELLPLLKKVVNVRTVELKGLHVDLQRSADGTTNWDDLLSATAAEEEPETTDDGSVALAGLEVGGIDISDANVSWKDATTGTDVKLSDFNLSTDSIELAKPFNLNTDFAVASDSMGLAATVNGAAEIAVDLDNQVYTVSGLKFNTDAKGASLPNGALQLGLGADILANLNDQTVTVKGLALDTLGLILSGNVDVANLDTEAAVSGQLSSNEFSVLDLFSKLGIEAPVTADPDVLKKASMSLALSATPNSAALNDLTIKLDDTTFKGKASVPSLAGAIPPLRFDFGVDSIDLDRYLPPTAEGDAADTTVTAQTTTGDELIDLPLDMMRQLDIDGLFTVGSVKIMNLTTKDIAVPLKAAGGRITLDGVKANMYDGQLDSVIAMDATGNEPAFSVDMNLAGIEADPLLADLMQKDSFLTGNGQFASNITTSGNTVNKIKAALNGGFNTAFNDGSINGVNIGYQIRRAKAALTGKSLPENAEAVKTDFSALSVSGQFTNGVMQSDDLDLRSPLLRLGGAGKVDLPGEQVDYTLTTLITGTAQGQGGADLESLKGVKLDIPIQGSFDELAANFAGVILNGMKNNIANNIKGEAAARAKAEAAKLKAEAQKQLDAKKAEAQAKLNAEKAKAQERLQQEQAAAKEKAEAALKKGQDQVKDKLKGLFK